MNRFFFVFDVESIGLHGEAFAVGGGIYDEEGSARSEFIFSCPTAGANGATSDREWVEKNIPIFEDTHRSPVGVRDAFWQKWLEAKKQYPDITMSAERCWPVEARLLCDCVDDRPEERRWEGPYSLLEISSVMSAAGMNPMATYGRTPSELPAHNPLSDARQSARLLSEAFAKLRMARISPGGAVSIIVP